MRGWVILMRRLLIQHDLALRRQVVRRQHHTKETLPPPYRCQGQTTLHPLHLLLHMVELQQSEMLDILPNGTRPTTKATSLIDTRLLFGHAHCYHSNTVQPVRQKSNTWRGLSSISCLYSCFRSTRSALAATNWLKHCYCCRVFAL